MELYQILILVVFSIILTAAFFNFLKVSRNRLELLRKENEELKIGLAKAEERAVNLSIEKQNITALLKGEQEKLYGDLQLERQKNIEISRSYESTRTYLKAQQEKIAEQKTDIEKLQEKFNRDFEILAGKILEEKSQKFTELNRSNLDLLLNPLKENIKAFEEKVDKVYKSESDERNMLKGELNKLMELNKRISDEANNLTKALKADTKKQGNWGEMVLDKILEASGLLQGESYTKQTSFTDEEGNRLQPDVIIHLPENKHLVVDSKVSLLAYSRLVNAETDSERSVYLNEHITSLKNHIKSLCSKNYCDLYGINSPDFVLLFVPIESSFAIAIQHDLDLFEFAWNKRVVLVTPSTLLATLKTISSVWKQELQTRNAIDIATKAGALYDKFVSFMTDLKKVGDNIDRARLSYTDAFNKLSDGNGNIVGRIENLRKLGAKTSKLIDQKYLMEEE